MTLRRLDTVSSLLNRRFKILPERWFDFRTSCPKINCNPLLSMQSCISSSKYLFYLVLWELFIKRIHVFGGIWQFNEDNRNFYDQPWSVHLIDNGSFDSVHLMPVLLVDDASAKTYTLAHSKFKKVVSSKRQAHVYVTALKGSMIG